jgi:hypothetical protein
MFRPFRRIPAKIVVFCAGGALACALSATAAFAQDNAFDGAWPTSTFGAMQLHQEGDEVRGRYDFKGGRLRGHADNRDVSGVWAQDYADHRCPEERMGSRYWGRFEFHVNRDGDALHGHWGYCDESPDREWTAHR